MNSELFRIPSNKGPRRRFDSVAGMPSGSVPWCVCGKRGVDKCAECRDRERKRMLDMQAEDAVLCSLKRQFGD